MFHGKKYNVTKRLMVLLDTTVSFSNFTYFEFSKWLELTGQNKNAFFSKQIKVTFGNLSPCFQMILWQNVKKMCLLIGLIITNPICTFYSLGFLEYVWNIPFLLRGGLLSFGFSSGTLCEWIVTLTVMLCQQYMVRGLSHGTVIQWKFQFWPLLNPLNSELFFPVLPVSFNISHSAHHYSLFTV